VDCNSKAQAGSLRYVEWIETILPPIQYSLKRVDCNINAEFHDRGSLLSVKWIVMARWVRNLWLTEWIATGTGLSELKLESVILLNGVA
jgi:hypothetical protein